MLQAVRRFLGESPTATFTIEDMFIAGNRAMVQWRYTSSEGQVRGVDVIRVADERAAESFT